MNDENFNDPLADFDPVMESAFSTTDQPNDPVASEETATTSENNQQPTPEPSPEDSDLSMDESFFDDDESFDIDESLFDEKQSNDGVTVSSVNFDSPKSSVGENQTYDKNLFKNIKVDVSIELGRTKISLKKLYELQSGSIVEMSRLVGEPLDLVINDQVIAKGEVVAVNSNYGIRITHVESLNNIA
ncbi:MAG: flagellar motor switch protein FliN [Candidatus Margulisiibacteriota bacterium]